MKYLKLFENHEETLYTKIDIDEFEYNILPGWPSSIKINPDDYVKFTPREISVVLNMMKNVDKQIDVNEDIEYDKRPLLLVEKIFGGRATTRIRVYQNTDEWFFVDFDGYWMKDTSSEYYKCDQFEGLLQCLDSILKNIKYW